MKIITLNMAGRNNFGGDFQQRMRDVAVFLDKEQADVVCLQEVSFTKGQSLADRVNDMMNNAYPSVLAQMSDNCAFGKLGEKFERFRKKWDAGLVEHDGGYVSDGMAILSREPIMKSSSIILKPAPVAEDGRPDYRVRLAQIVRLESGLSLANVHFASNSNSYVQLRELLEYTNPDVITGDFNIHTWNLKKYSDIWDAKYRESTDFRDYVSFPKENATFDHMLLGEGWEFEKIEKYDGISDHSAMIFTINRAS